MRRWEGAKVGLLQVRRCVANSRFATFVESPLRDPRPALHPPVLRRDNQWLSCDTVTVHDECC